MIKNKYSYHLFVAETPAPDKPEPDCPTGFVFAVLCLVVQNVHVYMYITKTPLSSSLLLSQIHSPYIMRR